MDKDDLDKWCLKEGFPIIKFLDIKPAKLSGYKLCFNYLSKRRKAGAANIMNFRGSNVYGLLIEIQDSARETIREKENYPYSYNEHFIDVETFERKIVRGVLTYKVVEEKEKKEHQPPTKYYINLIIKNAEKYEFPSDYIDYLKSLEIK